ncbi:MULTISPECIES: hypothetical protein [unclassified Pseudonocardia]|uniref:hypothetical protein n=1 Tax=unclassified Pseudonocardia TaxID=2619320 RepID=UPI000ADE962A
MVGGDLPGPRRRSRAIDAFLPKIEELVEKSEGKVRADVVHRWLAAWVHRGESHPLCGGGGRSGVEAAASAGVSAVGA